MTKVRAARPSSARGWRSCFGASRRETSAASSCTDIDADAGSLAGLQVNMLATFAEWEREIIRERIADGRGAIRARGERSAGRVPFGYRTDPATKQLVVDKGIATTGGLLTCGACGKVMSPAMSEAMTSKLVMRLQRKPNAVSRYYRCRTNG